MTEKRSGLAVASLVLGIIAICTFFIPIINVISLILAFLAFIFGLISVIRRAGTGQAVAGLVLGIISILLTILMIVSTVDTVNDAVDALNGDTTVTTVKNTNDNKDNEKIVSMGETISEKDWEVTIKETGFKQDIVPKNPQSFYSHYQVEDTNNTYFYLIVEAKNISAISLRADKVGSVKMKYNNKYEYSTFATFEESGGKDFTYTNITSIKPLTTGTLYYLVQVPKTIADETDTPVCAEIKVNDNIYKLNIR